MENFSSPHASGNFTSLATTFIHYPFLYLSVLFGIILIIWALTKKPILDLLDLGVKVLPIIWLAPIIDLIFFGPGNTQMSYLFNSPGELLKNFFSFFGPISQQHLTLGIRIEILVLLIGILVFVYKHTKKLSKVILAGVFSYLMVFFIDAFPSLLLLANRRGFQYQNIQDFFANIFNFSWLNTVPLVFKIDPAFKFEEQFNILISSCFFLIILFELFILFAVINRKVWLAWLKNFRWERTLYYFGFGILGLGISAKSFPALNFSNFQNIVSLMIFFILIALSFALAVIVNDVEDINIDTVSNHSRPLITGVLSMPTTKLVGIVILLLILYGALLLPYNLFIFFLLFQISFFLYSVPPLKLKRHFLSSSISQAFNALLMTLSGFFLLAPDQKLLAFPSKYLWLILIGIFIFSNIKDFKDYAGDKLADIKTLPVVFGLEKSKLILSAASLIFLIIMPIILKNNSLLIISIATAGLVWYFLNRKIYKEIYLFLVFFVYLGVFTFLV